MRVTSKYLLTKHVIIHNDNEQEYDIRFALVQLEQGSEKEIRECTEFAQNPRVNSVETMLLGNVVTFLDANRDDSQAHWLEVYLDGEEDQVEITEKQYDDWGHWLGVDTVNHRIRIYDDGFLFYADMKHSDIELETKLFNLKDFD
jgi:hypothetical protein